MARAFAQEPQFIVLDEPTASLDFGNQGKVMREIRALAASGHASPRMIPITRCAAPTGRISCETASVLLKDVSPTFSIAKGSKRSTVRRLKSLPMPRLAEARFYPVEPGRRSGAQILTVETRTVGSSSRIRAMARLASR